MGIKKKILLGWLAFEIAAIPFAIPTAAKMIKMSSPDIPHRAASANIPSKPGMARILVASDGPFAVISEKALGEMNVSIHASGTIRGKKFGSLAKPVGPDQMCSFANTSGANIIYTSKRATAPNHGPVIDQAIIVEIKYDPSLHPEFSVETLQSGIVKASHIAPVCSA